MASSLHSSSLRPVVAAAAVMALYPKGLVGTEWLVAQGSRHEIPRLEAGLVNPELSSSLMNWGIRSQTSVDEMGAQDWQVAYGEHRRSNLQAAAMDPARMVQYVAGRPCVVLG